MVMKGIVLGHVVSKNGIEVDRAKIELISKLLSPKTVKETVHFWGMRASTEDLFKTLAKKTAHFVPS